MNKTLILLLFPLMIFAQEIALVGDVDCDGQITSEDASLILQFVTNVIDTLPCEENMTGLTPEQLQEIISMMEEQLSLNYNGLSPGMQYLPTMISSISNEQMYWSDALVYCADLIENNYSDWFLPNADQLTYATSGGCELPDERTEDIWLWTTSKSHYSSSHIITLSESGSSGLNSYSGANQLNCRCVRNEASEMNEVVSNNGNNSVLTVDGTEQSFSMMGPMYLAAEFPDFIHFNPITSGSYMQDIALSWIDAKRFCGQLEYNGYNDWFLPSLNQIMNYYSQNDFITITNINNFISPWNSNYHFWTNSDTGAGAAGQSPYYKALVNIYLPNTTINDNDEDLLDASNRLLHISYANVDGDYRGCFCVR
tara:strand:+ start:499 stop:1602 length:1104 start_codon:yes stop_codon:yes gene_type:complete